MASFSLGVGIGPTQKRRRSPPFVFTNACDLLLLDASQESGSNGAALGTLTDRSVAGLHSFTQATGGNKPTLNTSWQGSKAYATNGSQWATTASGIVTSLAAWSCVWAGQFSATGTVCGWFLGTNATDGIDWNAGRNGAGKFGVFARTVGAVDTNVNADTSPHLVLISYDAAATPKWHIRIDGVDTTLSSANLVPANPSALSIFGATNSTGTFGMSGNTGLWGIGTGVWDATTRSSITALAKSIWTGLP